LLDPVVKRSYKETVRVYEKGNEILRKALFFSILNKR
jgi:hypothetical protein